MNIRTSLVLLSVSVASVAGANLNFGDFSDTTGLVLNGNAASVGGALRLTEAEQWQRGTVWAAEKQSVVEGFETSFNYHIGEGNAADGLTFTIHNGNPWDMGGMGHSLGFNGISGAYGVQFRTHIYNAIEIGGNIDAAAASLAKDDLRGNHDVRITYVPGTMSV